MNFFASSFLPKHFSVKPLLNRASRCEESIVNTLSNISNASLYLEYFRNNIDRFFSQVKKGESFKGYEVAGRVITHTQIQMIHFPYHILDVDEEYVKEAFTDWMRPGNVFSNFNPDFDYDKPVAQSTEFYAMFSDIVHKAIEY